MPLQPIVPALILVTTISIVAMVWAVGGNARSVSLWAAFGFATVAVAITFLVNKPIWDNPPSLSQDEAVQTARRNAWLMATIYAWGGFAMFAIYTLTELWWWHSWQYGAAMLAIAAGLLIHAAQMGQATSNLRSPTALTAGAIVAGAQAVGAAAALVFLVTAGKLGSLGPDWPANHVFLAGGLAIIAVSLIATYSHRRLRPAS